MTAGPSKNVAASVRDRLMQRSRTRNEDFNFVLLRYAMERLLYRLSRSAHGPTFVLKGAILFTVWSSGHPHRATKDIDLLGFGTPDLERLAEVFRDVCVFGAEDDGVVFDASSVTAMKIKEAASYEGVRIHVRGKLGSANLDVQVDVGFGDVITPAPVVDDFPTLLEFPSPKLRMYPRETVVAEKLEAMVHLGIANSRMKDFFDVRFLARSFEFDGALLTEAIAATFARRETAIPPNDPVAFTATFVNDAAKNAQWNAFFRRVGATDEPLVLVDAVADIRAFLEPPLEALRAGTSFSGWWSSGKWT